MVELGSDAENLDILFWSLLIQLALSNCFEEDSKFPPALIYLLHLHTASASNLQQTFFKKCFCATLEPLKILSKVFNSSKAFFSAFLNKIILPLPLLGVPVHILYWPYVVVFLLQFYTDCISVCESILFLDQHCIRVWFKKEFLHFFCSSRTDDLGQ